MNVGGREIGYLFGQYKRLTNQFTGVLTGKGLSFGGSLIRPEATGYGNIYFAANMLATKKETLEGKVCSVSGAGNVATYAVEKLLQLGAKPVTLSDRSGWIYEKDGFTQEKLDWIKNLKTVKRGELSEYAKEFKSAEFHAQGRPWVVPVDCAFPCARQNELDGKDAATLL